MPSLDRGFLATLAGTLPEAVVPNHRLVGAGPEGRMFAAGGTRVLLQRTHDGREDVASVLGDWARKHGTTSVQSCRLDLAMGILLFPFKTQAMPQAIE
jgi:hypothetical protein